MTLHHEVDRHRQVRSGKMKPVGIQARKQLQRLPMKTPEFVLLRPNRRPFDQHGVFPSRQVVVGR